MREEERIHMDDATESLMTKQREEINLEVSKYNRIFAT